jgi:glycosyltransferase involved in cell wall biosynthesis
MHIGFDGKRATQNFRGLGNYSRGLIEGLLQYSEEELFLYSAKVRDERALNWLKKNQNPRLHLKMPEGTLAQAVPSLWRSFSILNDLKRDKLDLYHGLSHEIPVGASGYKFKTVVTIHDLIFLRYPEYFPLIDRITYKKKFNYSSHNADMVIAICEQTKVDLINLLGVDEKKIIVHYQSCDPIFYAQRSEEEKNILIKKYKFTRSFILNVGAFEERKNQLALIESFAIASNKIKQDLVLVGNGKKYLEQCKNKVLELGIVDRVHFLSNIPFNELPILYQCADVFCFPSHFEGFGIPIVEALFSKTPVITSYGSCFPESAGPDSEYIDPSSTADISEKLIKVLGDNGLREKMIINGYKFVQKFSREESTKKLLDCYSRIF